LVGVYLVAFLIQSYSLTIAQFAPLLSVMAIGQPSGVIAGGPPADSFTKTKIGAVVHGLAGLSAVALMLASEGSEECYKPRGNDHRDVRDGNEMTEDGRASDE
jgi:hypothetical protein